MKKSEIIPSQLKEKHLDELYKKYNDLFIKDLSIKLCEDIYCVKYCYCFFYITHLLMEFEFKHLIKKFREDGFDVEVEFEDINRITAIIVTWNKNETNKESTKDKQNG
jgi:hypothetical protein